MDTSAAGEGPSFTFRIKQEPGQCETAANEDDNGRTIRKVTVLDPLKLKLLSRQNHHSLLSGLNAAKVKAKPPAPTPPPSLPTTTASTTTVTASDGELSRNSTTTHCIPADPEPVTDQPAEPPPLATQPTPPTVVKAPGPGGGSGLFRRKKVVPAVIAKKIAQKIKAKSAPQAEATKDAAPATTATDDSDLPAPLVEENISNETQPVESASSVVIKKETTEEVIRPTAFRRIKPKVAICLNPSRPKKSILKKNSSSELLSGSNERNLSDLIPEETIVLEDDDDENEVHRIQQSNAKEEEEQKRKQHEEEQRIRVEEERRNKHMEERKAAEEKRRIEEEEEQRKRTEERLRIEEEERQRMKEEEKKVAEERRRIEDEEEIRQVEERRRIVEEEKEKVAEQRRIEEAENHRRTEEEEKKKIEENARREAEDRNKVEVSRKSRKIPAEVWKRQMEKMRTNPNRMHSAVIGSCSSQPPMGSKDSDTVEKSDVTNAKELVSVKAPVVAQQKPKQVVISAEQLTPIPVKEIRRICPLPPSVAQQLMKSVALNSELRKPQELVNLKPPNESNPAPVAASESSAVLGNSQTKAIRRISRLPPNLANVVFSAVKQSAAQENNIDKEEQMLPAAVPGKVSNEVEKIEKTEIPAPGMKKIKRIARLPPDIAKKLLSSVNKKIPITDSTAIKPETNKQATETTPLTPQPCQLPAEPLTVPTVSFQASLDPTPVQEAAPQKEIRRISQLPRNVAMKLVDSLKQKGIVVPKLVLEKETVLPETKSIAPGECQLSSEPTTPSSISSVPEIKVEPHEPSTKTRQKVEILSQVILPTASYNLEELLAGKSTDGMNTGPSGGVPLPLPMPRVRMPEVLVPVTHVPDPIQDLPMIDDDVGSEVTVTTEKDDTVESMHATSDNNIVPDSENIPVQYDPQPKNIFQLHEARNQTVQQTFISGGEVPTSEQPGSSYTTSSPHAVYQQSIHSPVVIQQPTSTHSGQPSITYYAKNPNSQPTSQPTPGPCRQHITIISRSAMNTSRMMNQRMVLNPASVEQSPTQGQRHRFAATQYVLVRNPAPIRGRTVPQIPNQVQHQQQQSRQHLMVPKATYYHRYPTNVQNQHQIIYPTPRFMLSQQSQIPSQPQPLQRPQFNYAFPTTPGQNKAFRPVDPAQNFSHAQLTQSPGIIPKIVIDSSYVEQQDRSLPSTPRSPLHEQPKPPLQNSSPCSEEIRNKLRDKVRTRMLRQKGQSESPSLETPPSLPPPPPSASAPMATQPTVPKSVPVSEPRIQSIQNLKTQVYLPQDFPQPRMQLARISQPPSKPADHRVIKQYICQGRKIYLTKISVTKPPQTAQSRPHVQQYQWDTGFHGFPQAVIKNDQRIFQQFSETVQQLERKISPEPPLEGMENPHVQNVKGRMKSRKPSVVTAVTTGLEGETFIITELIDPPEVAQEVQIAESTKDVPVKLPPRITTRRKTFVVDDSDVEFRAEQLPCVGTTDQEENQGKEFPEVKVKVENEEREKSAEGRSAFVRRMKEEEFLDSDTSQADEDLARDILALVEQERESLRLDLPAKKIKKRIKRKKRRKKKKNGNKEMMDLLMKHVNQESLIADIVATQRKQLPVIELSDTDEDSVGKTQHVVHVKKESDSALPTELMRSTESEVEIDSNESETDIFAEILKPFVDMNKEEEKREDTAKTVTAEPQEVCQQEEGNLETLGPQKEDCRKEREEPEILTSALVEEEKEEENRRIESAVTEEPQKDGGKQEKELETTSVNTAEPEKEATPVEQSINVPTLTNETTAIQEISAATATDPNPVIELNQPTTKCDQTCDTSCALPLEKPKPKKALAPRAPKRKLKPMLVARSKIRKVEPLPPVQIEVECANADDIEDSSDPFSDRDEPLPAAVEDADQQEAKPNETADSLKPSCVRELVNEWDSDEASKDLTQPTTVRPFGKHVSFDNNGNMPCRISKNNALKRTAILNDQEVESTAIEKPTEEPVQLPQEVPVPVSTEVKSVRVSVRKTDLIERQKTPEPVAVQIEESENNTRVESTQQSVLNLLKDWEDSPVKQRIDQPKVVARVPLDRINSVELASLKNNVQPAAVQIETPDKPKEVSVDRESSIVLENIALNDQNRWDEPSASEPERIIGRIIYDKELYEKVHGVSKDSSTELDDSMSFAAITQNTSSRQTRSHKKLSIVPNVSKSPTTRSSISKQTSIKSWLSSTTTDSPSQEPVVVQQKAVPKAKRKAAEKVAETQKPAGRTLRSRTKSVFVEKAPMVEKPAPAPDSTETKVGEATSESQTEVMKEAGGAASVARNAEEQESKECSTPKPAPIVRNRIPIQISSEDEDDAPLAKRRKVLRKRRYMMRQRDRVRNLSANRRLFRGGTAHRGTLIADGNYLGETTFIKTEPVEVADTPEYYAAPHESFTVINPEAGTEQLLSVVTVQNNQIIHAQNYDVATPPRKQYLSKDLVQSTEPTATSTPIPALAIAPAEEHVFATPEPVRIAKRKRRTRQELEADRQAKQQKKDEDAIEQSRQQEIKARTKRDSKPYVSINPETVDPTIQEFQCATCSENVPRDMWDGHYAKHVGLTYRVNVDPVIDLYDETTATAIVTRFMKVHRQVTIHCDKCNVAKKSAVGLVSHRLICGLTKQEIEESKVTCEHCNRKLMAVSMNCHLSAHCPVLKKKKMEQALDLAKIKCEEAGSDVDPAMLTQRGTIKRKATAKAEKRIQNLSYSELILSVSKDKVTDGCLALWKTQFRKAKTALCVFQKCDFTGNDEMEMRHHHEFCPSPNELFECKNCKYQTEQIEQMAKHIKLKHASVLAIITAADSSGTDANITSESSDDEGTSGVDENEQPLSAACFNEKPKKAKPKTLKSLLKSNNRLGNCTRDQFNEESDVYREMVLDELIQLRSLKSDFHLTARDWTAEFRVENYSRIALFRDLRPDVDVRFLTFNMVQEYIPKRVRSLRFILRSTNLYNAPVLAQEYTDKWQHLEAFTGQANGKESMFYCGGPIVALDWLPVPDGNDEHQILAVACKNDFEEFYLADRIYPTKCLIQIWDVGYLSNSNLYNKKVENSVPALLYSIACDFGPIWSLKFCPSGCYNSKDGGDEYERLGLLAAAGSDGNVYIFSLGRNYDHLISNSYRVVNLTPVLKLTLSLDSDSSSPQYECHSAVKLSWSKSKNHAIIAAGYSNGAVAVWNLNSTSSLLMGTKDGVRGLLPVHKAFIPDSCITAVDLHYTDNTRYLLVCNADRKVVVFDLSTGYVPVEVCSVNARSKVTTACWNTHFPLITMAFDDVYAIDRCALTFHQTREIGLRLHPLYTFTAEATDMSSSDHLSTHVIGTDGGDVLCHQPMAYIHHMGQKNTQLMKYVLTSTISVKVNEELTDNSYSMFYNNYGMLFSDSDKNSARMDLRSLQVKSFRRALLHEYPGIRINQVQWNPNERSHQYYAIGYQAGFVRVRSFRFK